jgi:hypothetical protein
MLSKLLLAFHAGEHSRNVRSPLRVRSPVVAQSSLGRRDWLSSAAAAAALGWIPLKAKASGGATAGRTTSIPKAKTRYYGRVTAFVAAFAAFDPLVKSGELTMKNAAAASFFSDSKTSPIEDFKIAGYLLAAAFKIDASIPPARVEAVIAETKFMKDLEAFKGALKSGKADKVSDTYATASASLSAYLQQVELPPLGDAQYSLAA